MLAALKEMHVLNFVHRDVNFNNFMVDNRVVKIIDFGLTTEFIREGKHILH
jgi:serine/threonine protein kinase